MGALVTGEAGAPGWPRTVDAKQTSIGGPQLMPPPEAMPRPTSSIRRRVLLPWLAADEILLVPKDVGASQILA
jgi:hypothetical protein